MYPDELGDPADITFALVYDPPAGLLASLYARVLGRLIWTVVLSASHAILTCDQCYTSPPPLLLPLSAELETVCKKENFVLICNAIWSMFAAGRTSLLRCRSPPGILGLGLDFVPILPHFSAMYRHSMLPTRVCVCQTSPIPAGLLGGAKLNISSTGMAGLSVCNNVPLAEQL